MLRIKPNCPLNTYPKKLQILYNIYNLVASLRSVTYTGKIHMPYSLTKIEKEEALKLLLDLIKIEGKKEGVEIIDNSSRN